MDEVRDALFVFKPCPVCGQRQYETLYPVDLSYAESVSGLHITGELPHVASCSACQHQFIQPGPTIEFIHAFYRSYMGEAKHGFYNARANEKIPPDFRSRYLGLIEIMKTLSPGADKLLDVGAGLGMFLRLAKDCGMNVQGIEPNSDAAQVLTEKYGIPVENCLLEESVGLSDGLDFITMWDLLEHLTDPVVALKKTHSLLKDNGILVVEIPVRDSLIHWLVRMLYIFSGGVVRRPLYLVCGVHHLQYFSSTNFANLLDCCGFTVEKELRRGTEFSALKKSAEGSFVKSSYAVFYNFCINFVLVAASLFGKENKLVVFARKRP